MSKIYVYRNKSFKIANPSIYYMEITYNSHNIIPLIPINNNTTVCANQ